MHSFVNSIFNKEIQRPSAEKEWQIPQERELPGPCPLPERSTPLEVQATSYLAASERIASFSMRERFCSILIVDYLRKYR